jgi:RNA polymerase sigma-70 factor (ECF subfamily)
MNADLGPILKAAYPQVVATLVRVLGDMDKAMDATQDALVKALQNWHTQGVPEQPVAWLVTVARNRAVDQIRRESRAISIDSNVVPLVTEKLVNEPDFDILLSDVDDDLLRLMFTCCHPALASSAQIALVLKVVLGFSVEEIARALLASKASIDKRITRAKQKLRADQIPYEVPATEALPERLDAVLKAIYLLFNEGYSRIQDGHVARNSLIEEAIRLGRMVSRLFRHDSEPRSLLALMLLSAARLPARLDASGAFVPLHEQDRTRWNHAMISEGVAVIDAVHAARHLPGPYQIQAAISAIHSQAVVAEDTDWTQIVALYEKLKGYDRSPVVVINTAVALCYCGQVDRAVASLQNLPDTGQLENYQPLYAALAFVHEFAGDDDSARPAYVRAMELAASAAQKAYLQKKLNLLEMRYSSA